MSHLHILLVCDGTDRTGGWYTYTRNLADALRGKSHDVTVTDRGARKSTGLHAPLELLTNPLKAWRDGRTLAKLIQELKPDVIHVTVEPYLLPFAFLPKAICAKTILTVHGSYGVRLWNHLFSKWLARKAFGKIGQVITVSDYTKTRMGEAIRDTISASLAKAIIDKTTVIPNGIHVPSTWTEATDAPVKKIISVGGVKPRKGILEAIDACAAYEKISSTPFRFEIIGSCPEGDAYVDLVRSKIAELKLGASIILRGGINEKELDAAYASADLLLLPARTDPDTFEGFGLVYLEANAWGVPCIGPDTSGAAEAIAEGKSGYKVRIDDPAMIAERMKWILDEHRIDRKDARAWAEQHSLVHMTAKTSEIYRTVNQEL